MSSQIKGSQGVQSSVELHPFPPGDPRNQLPPSPEKTGNSQKTTTTYTPAQLRSALDNHQGLNDGQGDIASNPLISQVGKAQYLKLYDALVSPTGIVSPKSVRALFAEAQKARARGVHDTSLIDTLWLFANTTGIQRNDALDGTFREGLRQFAPEELLPRDTGGRVSPDRFA